MRKLTLKLLFIPVVIFMTSLLVLGQDTPRLTPPPASVPPQNIPGSQVYGGYQIGIGDILDIHVNDEDSVTGRYQVDQDGNVRVPLLSGPVKAAGSTTFELASRLRDELKDQKILVDPGVTVLIVRGMTQNVLVLGAVMRPGTYPLEKFTTIMDVISLAGGLAPNAGDTLTISHQPDSTGSAGKGRPTPINSVNITNLLSAKDPALNLQIHPGDVISIATAPVIYVVGAVVRPGAFTVQDPRSRLTVLQAVALAQGAVPTASLGRTIIIRKSSSDSERQDIPIDLKKMMRGKAKDEVLEANDILFIPQSALKAGLHRMGDIGASAAGQATGYAVGFGLIP